MPTFSNTVLKQLLEVQKIDTRIGALEAEIEKAGQRRKEVAESLRPAHSQLKQARDVYERQFKRSRALSVEAEELREQRRKVLSQTAGIKDNELYRRMLHEADQHQHEAGKLEEEALRLMAELEDAKKAVAAGEELLKGKLIQVQNDVTAIEKRREELQEMIPQMKKERQALVAKIPVDELLYYERLFRSKGGRREVVVELNGENCGFCHLHLSKMNQGEGRGKAGECENCGAIIYKEI